jgi:hypothetical protein
MIIQHATLVYIKVSISNAFLIEILLFFKILYCSCLLLQCVFDLLVLSQQCLLFLVKPAYFFFHGYYLRCKVMHSPLELLISVLLISEIIFHVLINSVNIFLLVEKIILLGGTCHQGAKLSGKV